LRIDGCLAVRYTQQKEYVTNQPNLDCQTQNHMIIIDFAVTLENTDKQLTEVE